MVLYKLFISVRALPESNFSKLAKFFYFFELLSEAVLKGFAY